MSDAVKRYRFFDVRRRPAELHRKTRDFDVVNARSGAELGSIEWYGPWRQYVLTSHAGVVWSAGCLADVQDFMRNHARKVKSDE